jgi:hypothetical protein
MVETSLKYAKDEVTMRDLQLLMQPEIYPRLESGKPWLKSKAAPFGLYLTDIEYASDIFA